MNQEERNQQDENNQLIQNKQKNEKEKKVTLCKQFIKYMFSFKHCCFFIIMFFYFLIVHLYVYTISTELNEMKNNQENGKENI